jgi:hypothetical protein
MDANTTIPLTKMSKNPRYECISAFSLRGSYRIIGYFGELKWAINVSFRKIKAKPPK